MSPMTIQYAVDPRMDLMDEPIDPAQVRSILATLNREMSRPIDRFRADLDRFLNDTTAPLSAADRAHALVMKGLCDELRALTDECLGAGSRAPALGLDAPHPA